MNEALGISAVVENYGVSEWQLRYWDSEGILVPARVGNRRVYFRDHLERLAYITKKMSEGLRPGEIRLLALHGLLGVTLEKKSISKTVLLAERVKEAKRGDVIFEAFEEGNPSSYNSTYRRVERIAKRLGREFQIRQREDAKGLELIIKG